MIKILHDNLEVFYICILKEDTFYSFKFFIHAF